MDMLKDYKHLTNQPMNNTQQEEAERTKPQISSTYNLSKDYSKLYDLVSNNHIIAGFVNAENGTLRDVVKICARGLKSHGYILGCRGIEYNGTTADSKQQFIAACEERDLDWIDSALPKAEVVEKMREALEAAKNGLCKPLDFLEHQNLLAKITQALTIKS